MLLKPSLACFLAAFLAFAPPSFGEEAGKQQSAQQSPTAQGLPADSTTQHTTGEGEKRLTYSATAGTLPVTNDKGEVGARIFYVAYTTGEAGRPVSFVFNGGPGAASAFLHLAAIGPKVVNFTENGAKPVQPIELRNNPDSWLPFTDLVFVDPVGTGFSRASGGGEEATKPYYGVDQDADTMTEFVRLYLTRADRNLAPVYLIGESYGGFRSALLTERLLRKGVRVNGALLISPALEFSMIRGNEYALVPMALELPSIAASHLEMTAGYDAPLDPVREAEAFARKAYLLELVQGLTVSEPVKSKLSQLTGLDPETVARHHGRVNKWLFRQEYRRNHDRGISVYDGSITIALPRPAGHSDIDPILDDAVSVLTPVMMQYARETLGYRTDLPYELLNREVSGKWDYGTKPNRQGFAGSLGELQKARTLNPDLKLFIAHGYTDLATPYSVSEFLVSQLEPIENARPIELRAYRGGHMMYMRPASRRKLAEDASAIYASPAHR